MSNCKSNFIEIAVDALFDNSVTDFDLYLNLGNEIILYSTDGYLWEKEELERLLSQGYLTLLTSPHNQEKVSMYLQFSRMPRILNELEPTQRIRGIEDIGTAFTKLLYDGEITDSCVKKAETIAVALTDCLLESKSCVNSLQSLLSKEEYVFHHSIRVATYATAIAIELGLQDREQLLNLAFGGIFHDIGKSQVPRTILNKQGVLTDTERKVMQEHPQLGYRAFETSPLAEVSREIIIHHHERLDGNGYPHGLNNNQILPEVQIAALADIFDALTSNRSYQVARTRFEALEFIKARMVGNHIAKEYFRALVHCLKPQSKATA